MAQVPGSLLPSWQTWTEFLVPSADPPSPSNYKHLGNEKAEGVSVSLSLSLYLATQRNKYF